MTKLSFGDVVEHNGRNFVFLDSTESFIYLARVYRQDEPGIREMMQRYKALATGGRAMNVGSRSALFSYVVLTTKEVEGHVAHLLNNRNDADQVDGLTFRFPLDEKDRDDLRRAILEDSAPISVELRNKIKS